MCVGGVVCVTVHGIGGGGVACVRVHGMGGGCVCECVCVRVHGIGSTKIISNPLFKPP